MPSGSSCARTTSAFTLALLVSACGGPAATDTAAGETPAAERPDIQVTLSGLSSGAYMAVQTHVALAERVSGVAALAGGPYHCAQGDVRRALGACMSGEGLDVAALQTDTAAAAQRGDIAPLAELAGDRAWLYHSPGDAVVQGAVGAASVEFYAAHLAGDDLITVADVASAHGWPTLDQGNECAVMGGAYLNACDYDAAGALLTHLYGELAPRTADAAAVGSLQRIELEGWLPSGSGMASEGLIYVPDDCRAGSDCRLHISFHGCQQGVSFVDGQFAMGAGLNEWAGTNRIVVLYPQVRKALTNPLGCWDWWGYTGADYDRRDGKQITAIDNLITAFAQGQLPLD